MQGRSKVIFLGTPAFATFGLQSLLDHPDIIVKAVITQPDKPAGRGHKLQAPPVKELALQNNIAVFQPASIRKEWPDFKEKLTQLGEIDIAVVSAFGQLLPETFLAFPRLGCLNIHASLLPRWRGAAPIQHAIMAGDEETGISLMRIVKQLDAGPVFCKETVSITSDDCYTTLHDKLAKAGAELLSKSILSIISSDLKAKPQDETQVLYSPKITNEEARINWGLSATEIRNKIRALDPFPGAFTFLNDKRLKIYAAEALADSPTYNNQTPGTVLDCDRKQLTIKCASGLLSLKELQLAGKKRLSVANFLQGVSVSHGTKLA